MGRRSDHHTGIGSLECLEFGSRGSRLERPIVDTNLRRPGGISIFVRSRNQSIVMLSLESLRQQCASGQSFDYLYFWSHRPPNSGAINQSCQNLLGFALMDVRTQLLSD